MENLRNLFSRTKNLDSNFSVKNFVQQLSVDADAPRSALRVDQAIAVGVSNEDFGAETVDAMQNAYDAMGRTLNNLGFENYNADYGVQANRIGENMRAAAVVGALAAQGEAAYKKTLLAATRAIKTSDVNVITSVGSTSGANGTIGAFSEGVSLENYNEKSQRDFTVITAGFNLASSRQDAFAEAAYRTTLVQPQEGGAVQIVPYVAVMKDKYHKLTGSLFDASEVNLVDAYRDPSILEDSSTDLIPAIKTGAGGNEAFFVDAADIAPTPRADEHGNVYSTAPLKFNTKFDLIGVSNLSVLTDAGLLTIEDPIDPAGALKAIYVKATGADAANTGVIKFNVERMPSATFVPKLVGDTRGAAVSFETERLVVSASTRTVAGATLPAVTELETRKWTLELSVKIDGSLSLSRGNCQFISGSVVVEAIRDEDGSLIDKSSGAGATLLATLGTLSNIGFDLKARFTNSNRRKRGHLLQTRAVQFRYPIWMHSPITLPLSTLDEQGPGEVAQALTVANDIRNSANAVTAMLNYVAQLKETVGDGAVVAKFGDVEGALSIMMRGTYRYHKLDLTRGTLDTIRSGDRWNDVTSVILNTIKAILFPAYRDSNIESVFQVVSGNINEKPKFLILTDREIANYLQIPAEDRILGAMLKYDVVSTNNQKFDGKILVVPTRENPGENDVLNWGQFYFCPTIVGDLPITREGGSVSREICAIPFNRHVNNIPFAIEIDVVGLRDVMSSSMYNVLL